MMSEAMRARAQATEMALMARRSQRPVLREADTLSFQMTGMGRTQMMTSSRALQALLVPSKARMLMHLGLWSGFPTAQNAVIGVH